MFETLWKAFEENPYLITLTTFAICALLPFLIVLYNLFLHPLRDYPGPWYAGATRLWYVSKVLGGYHKYAIKDLHERYGQVVRIAPDELSYIHPKAWNDIYGRSAHLGGGERLEKDDDFFGAAFGNSDIIVDADSDNYKDQKKNAMRGFSTKALTSRSPAMSSYVQTTIENLKSHIAENQVPVNIEPFIGNAALDIHARLTIGHDFGAVKEGTQLHFLIRIMHKAVTVIQYAVLLTYLPSALKSIPSPFGGNDLFSVFGGVGPIGPAIAQRVEGDVNTGENDMVSYMKNSQDPKEVNQNEVKKNSYVFILSGLETIPGFVCSSLYYLLKTPEYYAQASSEIRGHFQHADEITVASAQEMPLLRAIIQETLRVSPPAVGTLPRKVPRHGSEICGKFVAEGTTVGIHNYSVTHYSPFWKDADGFHPERWLGSAEYAGDHREVFHPFGHGPRMCVARHLVLLEAGLFLANLLYNFDMELRDSPDWPVHQGHFVPTRGALFVSITEKAPREPVAPS